MGNDCTENNLAKVFSDNSYKTGIVGKWHLHRWNEADYTYSAAKAAINDCHFDSAEAIYIENLDSFFNDGTFSHNMEYVTQKAIDFIENAGSDPFFLYLNPTVPHGSGDVSDAITSFACTQTPEGTLSSESELSDAINKMSNGVHSTCDGYRDSIITRAGTESNNDNVLGEIWIDDAIGAIFKTLEEQGVLDNTFFLFQLDHGQEGKDTLYEPGSRIPQFIHYPDAFGTDGMTFDGKLPTLAHHLHFVKFIC